MAKVKSGIALGISGTIGEITLCQQPDGSTTARNKQKKSDKPRTTGQLSTQMDTSLISEFFRPISYYIEVGFELETNLSLNANNIAAPHLRKNAVTGVYPNRTIDYSKVLLTRGKMPPPKDATVTVTDIGFAFTWDTSVELPGTHFSDQIMLMAHFTALKKAVYVTGSAQRHTGHDLLVPNGIKQGTTAEIYVSFIASDRKSISNSIYLGQVNW